MFCRRGVTNYTDQLFAPHDSSNTQTSIFFLLQSNHPNEQYFDSKFAALSPVEFEAFDFYADSGPEDDGDNFIAKVQRVDIELLENMKRKFNNHRAKSVQGENVCLRNIVDTCVLSCIN